MIFLLSLHCLGTLDKNQMAGSRLPVAHATWEAEIRRMVVQGTKITRAKWTGGVGQGTERLLCKCEALSSKPSPTKEKKISTGWKPWVQSLPNNPS
jgi:hypothetical protein